MIKLNPYSWQDAEYWFEDEEDVFEFMKKNENMIIQYSFENGMTVKSGIDYLFRVRD